MSNILKWIATVILIVGTAVNGLGYYPAGPIILAVGGFVWLLVSIMWKEPALIVTNVVMTLTGVGTLVYKLAF
jgi:hypothetical protein